MTLLENLKKYFEETPREQVLKDWQEAEEETKDIESSTVEEFMLYIVGSPFYCFSEAVGELICKEQCLGCNTMEKNEKQ